MTKKKDKKLDIDQEDMYNNDDIEIFDEGVESNVELKIKKIMAKLKACEKERQEYLDGWQRSKAEFLNSKKAHTESLERIEIRYEVEFIERILPVLDSFDLAFSSLPEDIDPKNDWIKGVINIQSQFISVLKNSGVSVLDPIGEAFDPMRHESIGVAEVSDKKNDNTVVEVFQKGYEHKGMTLRPPKVRVAQYNDN
jgi:molecular chaperone GrpE